MFSSQSHRNNRRRRVLAEEAIASRTGSRGTGLAEDKEQPISIYGQAAQPERQARISDLIPRSHSTYVLFLLCGIGVVSGLAWLYDRLFPAAQQPLPQWVAIIDLASPTGLAAWFCSLLLAAVAAVAIFIFSLRRHKLSDYHGRYRLWFYVALAALMMSATATVPLHEVLAGLLAEQPIWQPPGDGAVWWLVPSLLVLGTIAVRLLMEINPCRSATAALLAAMLCYGATAGMRLDWPQGEHQTVLLQTVSQMAGHLFLFLAVSMYARYVLLEIEGLLPQREEKFDPDALDGEEEGVAVEAVSSTGGSKRASQSEVGSPTDLEPHSQTPRNTRQTQVDWNDQQSVLGALVNPGQTGHYSDTSGQVRRKMTKAERKRLRKLKRRQAGLR